MPGLLAAEAGHGLGVPTYRPRPQPARTRSSATNAGVLPAPSPEHPLRPICSAVAVRAAVKTSAVAAAFGGVIERGPPSVKGGIVLILDDPGGPAPPPGHGQAVDFVPWRLRDTYVRQVIEGMFVRIRPKRSRKTARKRLRVQRRHAKLQKGG